MFRCSCATLVMVSVAVVAAYAATSSDGSWNYNQNTALKAVYFSKAAYCNASALQSWNCGPACEENKDFKDVVAISSGEFQAFVGYSPDLQRIVVTFRGSRNIEYWFAHLMQDIILYTNFNCYDCMVSMEFYPLWTANSNAVLGAIATLMGKYGGPSIMISGHSLGGILALYAALDIGRKFGSQVPDITTYTFGAPRGATPGFNEFVSQKVQKTGIEYRITHANDPVVHQLDTFMGYLHAPHEVWYKGGLREGPILCVDSLHKEDPGCSASQTPDRFLTPHMTYLDVYMQCSGGGVPTPAPATPVPPTPYPPPPTPVPTFEPTLQPTFAPTYAPTLAPTPVPPPKPTHPYGVCNYIANMNITGAEIAKPKFAVSSFDCCKLCSVMPRCAAAVYENYYCHFMAGTSMVRSMGGTAITFPSLPPPPHPEEDDRGATKRAP